MADLLSSLPVDKTPLNHDEINILQTLFNEENSDNITNIFIELKDAVIGGILFAILSSKKFNIIIHKFIPSSKNSYIIMICIKTFIFIILFWIILNFALAKRN